MKKTFQELEHETLLRLAKEYETKGYIVSLQPKSSEMPLELRSFQVDMIARNKFETVLIEVTSISALQQTKFIDLARRIEKIPNYRFELITVSTKTADTRLSVNELDICRRCKEAQILVESFSDAALLLTWSAVEGMLRLIAQREHLDIMEKDPPLTVLRTVYASGLLQKDQYDIILRLAHVRNAIVHGFSSGTLDKEQVLKITELIQAKLQCA